jgi:hypothetical protein
MPMLDAVLDPALDLSKLNILQLRYALETGTYFGVDTENIFDEFCWKIGKTKATIAHYFRVTGKRRWNEPNNFEVRGDLPIALQQILTTHSNKRRLFPGSPLNSVYLGFCSDIPNSPLLAARHGNYLLFRRLLKKFKRVHPGKRFWDNVNSLKCAQYVIELERGRENFKEESFKEMKFITCVPEVREYLSSLGMQFQEYESTLMCASLNNMEEFQKLHAMKPFHLNHVNCHILAHIRQSKRDTSYMEWLIDNNYVQWSIVLLNKLLYYFSLDKLPPLFYAIKKSVETIPLQRLPTGHEGHEKLKLLYANGFRFTSLDDIIYCITEEQLRFFISQAHLFTEQDTLREAKRGDCEKSAIFKILNEINELPEEKFISLLVKQRYPFFSAKRCMTLMHLGGHRLAQKGAIPIIEDIDPDVLRYIHENIDAEYAPSSESLSSSSK